MVVATRNRPLKLANLLMTLETQSLNRGDYEVIVVDDGSEPAVRLEGGNVQVLRQESVERCRARNAGAAAARGELLIFVDDDMILSHGFLQAHWEAHRQWPNCMVIGAVHLRQTQLKTPYGQFRSAQDQNDWPHESAAPEPGKCADYCTAQNMSLDRRGFLELGGFDPGLTVSEDQDLGLRWVAAGGSIGFLPAGGAVHDDGLQDIRGYCQRMEWGQRQQVAFARKHPLLPSSLKRAAVNGPLRPGREPLPRSALKLLKNVLAFPLLLNTLFFWAARMERTGPRSTALKQLYKLLLAVHLQRGWRRGLRDFGERGG